MACNTFSKAFGQKSPASTHLAVVPPCAEHYKTVSFMKRSHRGKFSWAHRAQDKIREQTGEDECGSKTVTFGEWAEREKEDGIWKEGGWPNPRDSWQLLLLAHSDRTQLHIRGNSRGWSEDTHNPHGYVDDACLRRSRFGV